MITRKAILIERELQTDGHSPLLIADENFDKYVIKNSRGREPATYLINEWLCSAFLKLWTIPTPETALISVPKILLQEKTFSANHRLHYYDTVAFGSQYINGAIELNEFVYAKGRLNWKSIINRLDFLHIALFDTWIENDDRKPTNHNLLLEPSGNKFRIIAIDHAFVLSTLDYLNLKPEQFHPISNEHILISELGYSIKRSIPIDAALVEKERDYFYLCMKLCLDIFDTLVQEIAAIYPVDTERIKHLKAFLFDETRSEKVFNEYLYRLEQ